MRTPPENQPSPFLPPRDQAGRFLSPRAESARHGVSVAHAQAVLLADAHPVGDDLLPAPTPIRQIRPLDWDDELDGDYDWHDAGR